jgi:hypothetical protein
VALLAEKAVCHVQHSPPRLDKPALVPNEYKSLTEPPVRLGACRLVQLIRNQSSVFNWCKNVWILRDPGDSRKAMVAS